MSETKHSSEPWYYTNDATWPGAPHHMVEMAR